MCKELKIFSCFPSASEICCGSKRRCRQEHLAASAGSDSARWWQRQQTGARPSRAPVHAMGPLSRRGAEGRRPPPRTTAGTGRGVPGQGAAPRPIWAVPEDTGSWGIRPGASGPGGHVASPNHIPVTARVAPGKPSETGRRGAITARGLKGGLSTARRDGLGARGGHGRAQGARGQPRREGPRGSTHWSSLRKTPHTTLTATQNSASSSMRTCGRLWK